MDLGIDGQGGTGDGRLKGLGRATAMALAAEGVRVMISGRNASTLAAAREAVAEAGGEVDVCAGDVTDPDEPARLVAATVERFGGLDILVANAGGPPPGRALDLTDEAIEAAVNANLHHVGPAGPRGAAPHAGGRVGPDLLHHVVHGQAAGTRPGPVEHGPDRLWAWIKTAAQDLAAESSGITLNMLCPGPHATDRMKELGGSRGHGRPGRFRRGRRLPVLRPGRLRQRECRGGRRRRHPGAVAAPVRTFAGSGPGCRQLCPGARGRGGSIGRTGGGVVR